MSTPFPGMDPYLEHATLWTGVHSRLINVISQQIAPSLRPRYVTSIEERVMIDIPQHQRVPDVWIQKVSNAARENQTAVAVEEPVVMEVTSDPIREHYIEILDRYQDLQVVTVIEVLSPVNKTTGAGRDDFMQKRAASLSSTTNLVEIDLLRRGPRIVDFSDEQLAALAPLEYLISINRFQPNRAQHEFFPKRLRDTLPTFGIPLMAPDPDVPLNLQAALDQVYEDGSYMLRIRYEEACVPELSDSDQQWAWQCWSDYKTQHGELFA